MKHEIIKTDNYLLVVNESEIKEGDWMHRNDEQPTFVTPNFWWDFKDKYRKIISHLPLNNSPILEGVPLLPRFEQEDDVENLAEEWIDSNSHKWSNNNNEVGDNYGSFKSGYNKAKEKYRFTEEDMMKMFEAAIGLSSFSDTDDNKFQYALQSLSQPKMPTHFECDTVCDQCLDDDSVDSCYCHYGSYKIIPKTTTNSQGQTVWVGTYIFP